MSGFSTSSTEELLFTVDGECRKEREGMTTRTNTINEIRTFRESTKEGTVL